MLKKIGGLIKRHIILFALSLMAFIAMVIMLVIFLKMTISTSSKYGDRLDGIEEVKISASNLSDISDKLEEKDEVSKAKLRIQGKIIYVDISFVESTTLAKAKEIAGSVITSFDDDEQEFYDFRFVINQESDKEDSEVWGLVGSKNSKDSEISWTRS